MYLLPFQHCRRSSHIFHSSVGTRADDYLVNLNRLHCLYFINRLCIARKMRECYRRTDLRQIYFHHRVIVGICICLVDLVFLIGMFLHIFLGLFINQEDSILCACLNRHICHGKSIIHGKICNAVSYKFH